MNPPFFWGKFRKERYLPLASHCIDVAMVFRGLCELPGMRRALEAAAGRSLSEQDLDRLAVLALYHDIGKANLGFQQKVVDRRFVGVGHIRELGALFVDPNLASRFRDAINAELMSSWFEDDDAAEALLIAAWSHHGRPVSFKYETTGPVARAHRLWLADDGRDPMHATSELVDAARSAFPLAFTDGAPLPAAIALQHRFAGLLMLADWLGSDEDLYPVEEAPPLQRIEASRRVVPGQLRSVGLEVTSARRAASHLPSSFSGRFDFHPLPLQEAMETIRSDDTVCRLLVAESQTGSGKTEAALHWFVDLFRDGRVDGLYFALPTRVAAQELYLRVSTYISRLFPDPAARPTLVRAVPGYASAALAEPRPLPDPAALWEDDREFRARERTWAAEHPKRFLAATIAVGTIDQALLSAVKTSHAHLRSVCLDRSLLVVDEVHASDTYMRSLLEGLLRHHLSLGGFAMLLSATLGAAARSRLLSTWGNRIDIPTLAEAESMAYPALTSADGMTHDCAAKASQRSGADENHKSVEFELLPAAFHLEDVVDRVREAACAGARVLVVLNTVKRAVSFQRLVETANGERNWLFTYRGVACPHHGRFAPGDRLVLDPAVTERLGKGSSDGAVVLVGTQTLEQSLDIDSDLLITDLCPADVLLQRVGRLHRHSRNSRPEGFARPRCIVIVPDGEGLEHGLDAKGEALPNLKAAGWGSVYEDVRVLDLTWRVLKGHGTIMIPLHNRHVVEQTTHPERLREYVSENWRRHATIIAGREAAMRTAAYLATTSGGSGFQDLGMFAAPFGDFTWDDIGGQVTTRLGVDSRRLDLDHPVESPFGVTLTEMTIPGHMAPHVEAEQLVVRSAQDGLIRLRGGDRMYRYSRFGLEADDEPAD